MVMFAWLNDMDDVVVAGIVFDGGVVLVAFAVTVKARIVGLLEGSSPDAINAILYFPGAVLEFTSMVAVPE